MKYGSDYTFTEHLSVKITVDSLTTWGWGIRSTNPCVLGNLYKTDSAETELYSAFCSCRYPTADQKDDP